MVLIKKHTIHATEMHRRRTHTNRVTVIETMSRLELALYCSTKELRKAIQKFENNPPA